MKIPLSLDTERLVIRRYTKEDLQWLYRFFNNEKITSAADMATHWNLEDTKLFLDVVIDSYNTDEPIFAMAICKKEDGKIIGSCGFGELEFTPDMQIYYALEPEYMGNGYATEAVEKMIEYMILVLDIARISIFCSRKNTASIELARRIGMKYQGTSRKGEKDYEYFVLTREMYLHGA